MGAVCTTCKDLWEPIDITMKPSDIVGGTAPASLRSMKLEELPQERQSMASLEMESMTKTIYYRKRRQFVREGSLDFDDASTRTVRSLLAEPVGRFYLLEYGRAKDIKDFVARVSFCALYIKLRDEINAGDRVEKEEPGKETNAEREARLNLWTRNLVEVQLNPAVNGAVYTFAGSQFDEKARLEEAYANVSKLIHGLVPAVPINISTTATTTTPTTSTPTPTTSTLPINTADRAIRASVIQGVEGAYHAVFRALAATGQVEQFKEHSEYKRYKAKFQQVYNNINHEDFDFMATLGKGSFGRVIRVRKRTTGKQYAMKIMSKKKILSGAENAAQVTIERNVLVLCNSPNIVKVHFAFHTTRALFLCLDLLEGGTLSHAMHQCGGTMQHNHVVFHTAQMTLGLEHLHKHGILFRDLKPLNVMLDRKGNAVLTDMGLACKFRPSEFPEEEGAISASGQKLERRVSIPILPKEKLKCVGTYGFRAPELLNTEVERNGYGPAIDYWALGVTVYFLLTNKMPFKSRNQSILEAREKPKDTERRLQKSPPKISPDIDPSAQDVVRGLLNIDPEKRYGDSDLVSFKNHAFFKGIDWDKLSRRELVSPYQPNVPNHPPDEVPQFESVHAAMAQFTHENVLEMFGGETEMKDEYTHVPRSEQKHFRSWDFVPDSALELEWEIMEKNPSLVRRRRTIAPAANKQTDKPREGGTEGGAIPSPGTTTIGMNNNNNGDGGVTTTNKGGMVQIDMTHG
jgi:serine/threonine protein kinase